MTDGCYGLGVGASSRVYFANWTESLGGQRSRLRRCLLLLRVGEPPVTSTRLQIGVIDRDLWVAAVTSCSNARRNTDQTAHGERLIGIGC